MLMQALHEHCTSPPALQGRGRKNGHIFSTPEEVRVTEVAAPAIAARAAQNFWLQTLWSGRSNKNNNVAWLSSGVATRIFD